MSTSKTAASTGRGNTSPFRILQDRIFSAVALGHFSVDMLNGTRPISFTFLSASLGLTNTALAAMSTGYIWAASLSQPLFGWLADRYGTRWLASLGILWMCLFFGLALTISGPISVALLILASLGSAAFHPAGAMESTLIGRQSMAGRETTAASWFFFFGQFGLFMGPVLSGPLLDRLGDRGMLILAAVLLPIGINANWRLKNRPAAHSAHQGGRTAAQVLQASRKVILLLALVGAIQAWVQQNMITFLPKYLSDIGQSASSYGLIAGLFMGGSAVGNVIGGNLADRYGKLRVAAGMLLLATLPLLIISGIGWSWWLYLLVPLAGSLTGAVHSIVVVLAQRLLPTGMALASGLTLGFVFSAGALGTLLSGPFADSQGWPALFALTAGLSLLGALLAVALNRATNQVPA